HPQDGLVHKRLRLEVHVATLGTCLAGQELSSQIVTMGLRCRITHRKIMQGQGANLNTGFVGFPLRMARPETPAPLARLNGMADCLRGSVQEPQQCGSLQDLKHPSSSRSN